MSLQKIAAHYTGSPATRELSVPPEYAGLRLDQVLARLLPEHSRNRLQQWVREGLVQVDGKSVTPSSRVWGGETLAVRIPADPAKAAFQPEKIALNVVHEDESILVIDKPPGLVVHPGSGNWSGTMLNALLAHVPALAGLARAGIVHRLDKDTSGLLVVAKTPTAQTDLVRQLQARTMGREYLAIVHGEVARAGTVDAPVGRHPVARTRMAVVARGRPAATHYRPLEHRAQWSYLRCQLETGRTHQIRVHLSSIGHPLIGDPVYRKGRVAASLPQEARDFPRQALHAARLSLSHPQEGMAMSWDSPLPADMRRLLEALRDA
ncbi:MAG: 23S rRNA pseudouridine(1911/1915/1917) synthase RluD [Burkholderiales bacterium]